MTFLIHQPAGVGDGEMIVAAGGRGGGRGGGEPTFAAIAELISPEVTIIRNSSKRAFAWLPRLWLVERLR